MTQRLVDPDDVEERRQIGAKAADRVESNPPMEKRIGFHEHERGREQRRLAGLERAKRPLGTSVVEVASVEQRVERRRVGEDPRHLNASSR